MKGVKSQNVRKLLEYYREISLLGKIEAVLGWDLQVNLPSKASEERASQSAYLTEMITDKWLNPEFRNLLEETIIQKNELNFIEQAILCNLERGAKFYHRVPKEIIVEMSRTTSEAFMAWHKARKDNRFLEFLPYLKKIIELNQIIAQHLGFKKNPYDALLDLYEPGLTTEFVEQVFQKLQPFLTMLIGKIKTSAQTKKGMGLIGEGFAYSVSDQQQLALFVLKKIGYDLQAGRMDISPHPFTTELGHNDIRITNHYKVNDFRDSFLGAIHEAGHALYEQGINPEYSGTPLEGGISLGIHESQSRFWENQIGRNPEFLEYLTPVFQMLYQDQLSQTGSATLIKLLNQVRAGAIRVEADEVTYNLHIILRFELENALINNKIKAEDLPAIWQAKMKKYLGVVPETDSESVLQDMHWANGTFGYFPTYTLGNLYAAQFTARMQQELDLAELLKRGELGTILSWLRENIHQYGSLYQPEELIVKVTGEKLNPQYFLDYLKNKYSQIYQLR